MDAKSKQRFWSKVENSSGADCWQWLGCTGDGGYGCFYVKRNGKRITVLAHRFAWELQYGSIPEGMKVTHVCDNPGCCNPAHLKIDTHDGNMDDMVRKGRQAKGEKHGMYGNGYLVAGERNGQHKLTLELAEWIRAGAAGSGSQRFLANLFGVSQSSVSRVQSDKTWIE
jgi:hypothetical protein